MKRFSYSPWISILALLLGGCAGVVPMGSAPPSQPATIPEYLIGPDDVVSVKVWQNPGLDTEAPVRTDGKISVPLIGDVQAGGRSPAALTEEITAKLSSFVHDAPVSVQITELRSQEYMSRVRVTGAVRQPVSLTFRPGMTVLDAVLAAGGPTDFAASNRSTLYRQHDAAPRSYPIALGAMLERGDLSSNYPVQPGDVITVPQRSF